MGANCCVPARRDKRILISYGNRVESAHRNIRCSPSWNIRWDNRTHIEDIMDSPVRFHHHNGENVGSEIKSGADTETESHSDGGSPTDVSRIPKWQKSPIETSIAGKYDAGAADRFIRSHSSLEEKDSSKSAGIASARDPKQSLSLPSTPSSSTCGADPSSSRNRSFPSDPYLRKSRRSPGYQLSRQASDSRIPTLKALDENNSPDRTESFVLPACSNGLSNGGSHGGSSDGWSMRTFSELVASSQRGERWSFDSGNLTSIPSKAARSDTETSSASLSPDSQTCGVCSKPLKERSSWGPSELAVVAVLVCGHFYHAECLESETPATDKFDPPCPVCTGGGEKSASKLSGKVESKAKNKISRRAVADIDVVDGGDILEHRKSAEQGGKGSWLGASSSTKSTFGRPVPVIFRRHFSLGARPTRSAPESESTRKKGFWGRYR